MVISSIPKFKYIEFLLKLETNTILTHNYALGRDFYVIFPFHNTYIYIYIKFANPYTHTDIVAMELAALVGGMRLEGSGDYKFCT